MAVDDRKEYPDETREERRIRRARERAKKKKILLIISLIVLVLAALIIIVLVVLLKSRIDAENNTVVAAEIEDFEMSYVGEKTEFEDTDTIETSSDQNNGDSTDLGEVPTIDLSDITSTSGIMMRYEDQEVVFDLNSTERIYPASMTKILTTITAIENASDLSETYTFDGSEFDYAYAQGATSAGFYAGDTLSYLDILYGVMLPSGADASYAIAVAISGSEEAYVELMNQKAQEIGMTSSNFMNCTGLHDENHYTTCQDMIKLLHYSLQNETFRTIFCSHVYTTGPTATTENGIVLSSTTFTYISSSILSNGTEVEGGKTGFTDEAGHCLASLAKAEDGTEYIMVTAGAPGTANENTHLTDAVTIYSQLPGTGLIDTSDAIYSGDDLDFGEKIISSSDGDTSDTTSNDGTTEDYSTDYSGDYSGDYYSTDYYSDDYYSDDYYSTDYYSDTYYYEDDTYSY